MPDEITHPQADRGEREKGPLSGKPTLQMPPIGLALISPVNSQWIHFNDRLCKILGFKREELQKLSWAEIIHAEDRTDDLTQPVHLLGDSTSSYTLTFRLSGLNGRAVPAHVEVEGVRKPDGSINFLIVMVWEARDRRRVQEEAAETGQRAATGRQFPEFLSNIVGAIGHNFNNLLLPILGHTELLTLEVPATSPAHEHVQAVVDSVRAASEHCRELLLCAATGSYAGKPLHLSELIDDMGKLIRSLATKRSRLKFHLNGSLPFIFGDPNQIQQLLLCSVSNALESISGKNGAITLSTSARFIDRASLDATFLGRGLPEGTYVVLEIRDTGCGMDQETQDHLFEPFFSTKFGSSGLGMAMVMGIMRRHDGAIELHSQPGQGTVIRYLFPAAGESQEHIQLVDEKRTAEELHPQGAILLVDDEEPILRVSKMMLEKLGYAVITAKGGLEALDVFFNRRSEVVCIVLDITMPDLDGEAVYQAIRREDSSIPIILSSGYSEKGVADRFAGKAIAGFLPKPYGIAELREAILHALKWRR